MHLLVAFYSHTLQQLALLNPYFLSRFHNECLRQWGDTSCPVCRYCTHSGATTSHCATCNTSSGKPWVAGCNT